MEFFGIGGGMTMSRGAAACVAFFSPFGEKLSMPLRDLGAAAYRPPEPIGVEFEFFECPPPIEANTTLRAAKYSKNRGSNTQHNCPEIFEEAPPQNSRFE